MLGYGLGLRTVHYEYVLNNWPAVDWFEVITENYIAPGGRPRAILREIREKYPLVLHGLSFNIGSDQPVDTEYLTNLKILMREIEPEWISDHLCWTGIHGLTSHDLLPISYTRNNLSQCADKVNQIQDFLQTKIVLENPSTYIQFRSSEMSEGEFFNDLVQQSGCEILLDVNNAYVSGFNLGYDPYQYIDCLPIESIRQFHLAGHTNNQTHIIDTHDHPVCDEVWKLYRHACNRFSPIPTLLERDGRIPEFPELMEELALAKEIQQEIVAEQSARSGI